MFISTTLVSFFGKTRQWYFDIFCSYQLKNDLDLPPGPQDASGKYRFSSGFPTGLVQDSLPKN